MHAPLVLNAAPRVATGTRDYQPRPTSFKVPKHDKVDVSGGQQLCCAVCQDTDCTTMSCSCQGKRARR